MKFSKRMGIISSTKPLQLEIMDDALRNSLWSILTLCYWESYKSAYANDIVKDSNRELLIKRMWLNYFKDPVDNIPTFFDDCLSIIRKHFFKAPWNEVYDIIEFIARVGPEDIKPSFIVACNGYFEKENSAYRFVDGQITEITSETEIQSIEEAIGGSTKFSGVKKHLQTSLKLLSDRKNPDYRNSVKESISAIESLAKQVSSDKKAAFGEIVKELERKGQLHSALKKAFSSLYGYTSDAKGIRHALLDESNLTKSDAQFMLVCCSAFVNYVIDSTK